ncbi:lymphocyte expansion molecule-like isoform X2 [Leucoraja erinacea]|uniref:lymphocyte expansion molecule-like isoform X2 n=1 Tax=Leucoraja erinaceus TaxID=7782 RepID=UPI002455C09A|nr:lymphocyte expansion molecule-like isoform X2 [Leucoraja erinacea]
MEDKQFEGAPFGTQKARFDVYGVHPDNKLQGSYTEIPYDKRAISGPEARLGPAYYDVDTGDFSARIVAEKASGPGWAREKEMERFAQTPQLFYKEQKQKQKFLEINRGPGKYEVPHFLDLLAKKNIGKRGIFGTREERFKKQQSIISPGPGSYGKGGIPMAVLEEKANKSAGLRGMMDSNSTKSRSLEAMGCELSPNTYKIESGLDKLLRQVVSKRGPYDLFTGERGERIKSGHRATGDYGFYDVKQLSKPENQNPPPFLSSTSRAGHMPVKMLTFNPNNVGVGRYDPTKYDPKSGATYKSCFLSKTQRTLNNLERNKHMEERLRSTNSSNPDEVN